MKSVLIVGYGVVGHNLAKELDKLHPDIYDKYKTEYNTKQNKKYNFCFICVDTPFTQENINDISQVESALQENDADIYIIKSTVLPGTTAALRTKYVKRVIFSPEYYGGTQHCNNFDFNFTILGGVKEECIEVQQLLQEVYDARHTFRIVESRAAEIAKYMENSYIYLKVRFCKEFFDVCEKEMVDYEDVRECFILDPRVNPSHTFIYKEHPYVKSHCMDKDVPAIAEAYDMQLLKTAIKENENDIKEFEQ